ncbi:hypothetical protein SLS60_009114 [Paraconiothyrium brasiliense]|uniref:Uncharacterized protein n=1 Tax=Paraconiothyrium brasiliense TaxID=300254 RepID=A0ABR3QWD7_9PLEO
MIGEDCKPMEWQPHDEDVHAATGVRLTRCNTAVVLVLLSDRPWEAEKDEVSVVESRKERVKLPWQVLNLQFFPDWRATPNAFETGSAFHNGTDAFLTAVLTEFEDAIKRYNEVHNTIAHLVIPSHDFIFQESLRDERLFDDTSFSWTRRYFWALHVLPMINHSISTIIEVLEGFWNGSSPHFATLWPDYPRYDLREPTQRGCQPPSEHNVKQMTHFKTNLQNAKWELEKIREANAALIPQIKSLQTTLFNGTSVLESRRTVQQGENVKLLTVVNVLFLPLSFITGVFGMTNMPEDADFAKFGTVLVAVCLPLFALIGFASSHRGYTHIRTRAGRVLAWVKANVAGPKNNERDFDPLQHRKRYGLSRKDNSLTDLEALEVSAVDGEMRDNENSGIEDASHPYIKRIVEDIGKQGLIKTKRWIGNYDSDGAFRLH